MANVDTIMVISPGYMDAIKSCISRYTDFCIAGYSEVKRALHALIHIPCSNFLGFAYLNDNIREEDEEDLLLLINKVNIMYQDIVDDKGAKSRIPFIFLLSTKQGGKYASLSYLQTLLEGVTRNNLNVGYWNYDLVTDLVIKINMFGTILLSRRPFEVVHPEIEETTNNQKHLMINLPFEKKFIDLYQPLTYIEVDEYLEKYKQERILYLIRSYLYTKSERTMMAIREEIDKLDFKDSIIYEIVLRNLNLVRK